MFVLREISEDYTQRNYWIGDNYITTIKKHQPERFDKLVKIHNVSAPELYDGFVETDDNWFGLHESEHYYIMTESGKTFEKINL